MVQVEIFCPEVVAEYKIMGGVDKFDQLRERHALGRRSVHTTSRVKETTLSTEGFQSLIYSTSWNVHVSNGFCTAIELFLDHRVR